MSYLGRALVDIENERIRQVGKEGFDAAHDDRWQIGQLARAAACYAAIAAEGNKDVSYFWPWNPRRLKPAADARGNLVKAGALILAEIERLDRRAAVK